MHVIALLLALAAVIMFAVDYFAPRRFIALGLATLTVAWIVQLVAAGEGVTIG